MHVSNYSNFTLFPAFKNTVLLSCIFTRTRTSWSVLLVSQQFTHSPSHAISTVIAPRGDQPLYRASFPLRRYRRKDHEFSSVALQQHLCDSRSKSKISINLKRWMCTKQVRVYTAALHGHFRERITNLQHPRHLFCGMRTVLHPCPHQNLPSKTPAGSLVAPDKQAFLHSFQKFRRLSRDSSSRMELIQMRQMSVFYFHLREFLIPLQNPSVTSQLCQYDRRQLFTDRS